MSVEMKFGYCPTQNKLADYLTKVLSPGRFEMLIKALHVKSIGA